MSSRIPQAVVMVGGKGTRLRPLTDNRPKPLLPILGLPCVEYVIRRLADSGVEEVVMACGYRSEDMLRSIGDGDRFGISIEYSFEEEPAGTAGSVKLLEDRLDEVFMVASGDVLADVDLSGMAASHLRGGAVATMALTRVEDPCEFGIVGLDGEGMIDRFLEKPSPEEVFSNLINAGIYALDRRVLDEVPENRPHDFARDLFPRLLSQGEHLRGHVLDGFWKDIGRPADLLEANLRMAAIRRGTRCLSRLASSQVDADSAILPGSSIEGSRIESSVIGGNAMITGSLVRGSLLLPGVSVGRDSRIVGSIIGSGCRIGESASIEGCVLADGTEVPDRGRMSPPGREVGDGR